MLLDKRESRFALFLPAFSCAPKFLTLCSRVDTVEEFFLARGPSSSAEVCGLVIHDIKEVEGVRQQEEQEDKRDEEIGDEVNGEVEEVTQHTHETWR